MNNAERCFSPDYITARRRFGEAVTARDGRLDSLNVSAKGPAGEDLAIDIGWFGASNPRYVLVHSSGLHGVEAFAGSAIQLQWLEEGVAMLPENAAVVLVHALNPYGMAWLRRFNEKNVDLNRNFRDSIDENAIVPSHWQEVDAFLNPPTPPSEDHFYLRAAWLVMRYGLPRLKQAVAGGQHLNPKGLFFSGHTMEEGPAKFQAFLAKRLADAKRIVAIDVHTGLGRFGQDRLLVDAAPERHTVNRTMFGAYGKRVQRLNGDSVAYPVRGAQHDMYYRLFPNAEIYFATQEFGTYHPLRVVKALREENRWHLYGTGGIAHLSKKALVEAFNPKDPKWRTAVLRRGDEVIRQGLQLAFAP